jgi:hypothetical protein
MLLVNMTFTTVVSAECGVCKTKFGRSSLTHCVGRKSTSVILGLRHYTAVVANKNANSRAYPVISWRRCSKPDAPISDTDTPLVEARPVSSRTRTPACNRGPAVPVRVPGSHRETGST